MTDDLLNLAILAEAVEVGHVVTGGAYGTDGKWVASHSEPAPIMATVQPASGRQLMDMPEGLRTEARYFLWSGAALLVDDVVIYVGQRYKVIYTWPRRGDSFTRAALGLMKNDG